MTSQYYINQGNSTKLLMPSLDPLKRGPYVLALSAPHNIIIEELQEFSKSSKEILELIQKIEEDNLQTQGYTIRDGLVLYKDKFFILPNSVFVVKLLKEFHDCYVGDHSGVDRTFNRISHHFWWKGMMKDTREYVGKCVTCQMIKPVNQKPSGLLMPLPIPPSTWHDLSIDFITNLPKVQNKTIIILVVERLSKSCHQGALPTNYNAQMVAEFFVQKVIRLHGYPNSLVSAGDKVFTSRFWRELNRLCGTKPNQLIRHCGPQK